MASAGTKAVAAGTAATALIETAVTLYAPATYKQQLQIAAPAAGAALGWMTHEAIEALAVFRAGRRARAAKRRMAEEFGPTERALIRVVNHSRAAWQQAKREGRSSQHIKEHEAELRAAERKLKDYKAEAASLGISSYDSSLTVSGTPRDATDDSLFSYFGPAPRWPSDPVLAFPAAAPDVAALPGPRTQAARQRLSAQPRPKQNQEETNVQPVVPAAPAPASPRARRSRSGT